MSGGMFDYRQYQIRNIREDIESLLEKQGKEKEADELVFSKDYYEDFPEAKVHVTYPEKVQEIMKDTIKYLKLAEIYTQRVDWYLSGDDGEQSLYTRLEEDLKQIKQ